jgi:hypothetical protein
MPQIGSKTVERVDIFCPFCVSETGRWKLVPSVWHGPSSPRTKNRTPQPEAIDKQSLVDFERAVLQAHLPECKNKDILGERLLSLYGLTK